MVALVSKQVTAYNAVNNSTVSRTSASKYGKDLFADVDQETAAGEISDVTVVTRHWAAATKMMGRWIVDMILWWMEGGKDLVI